MRYRFYICDVFTGTRFGGNPLAVLPEAEGLTNTQMQQIAREFDFSETAFVLPPQAGHTRRVRIFTPATEVPFAGHPNIGTAFALAVTGEFGALDDSASVTFEEEAGIVAVTIRHTAQGETWCELAAPEPLSLGPEVAAETLAAAVSLEPGDIVTRTHPPRVASVGLPFLVAELTDRGALARARARTEHLEALAADGITADIHLYTRSTDDYDLRARMFAPLAGVPEDPATGSANCALAGLLGHCDDRADGPASWRIAQGVEMGRPSTLDARIEKRGGAVTGTWIGGACVMVADGDLRLD